MRFGLCAIVVVSCGGRPPVVETPVVVPVVTTPVVNTPPRLDRPPRMLGEMTWSSVVKPMEMTFCPGDRELVVLEDGRWLRRFDVETGKQTNAVHVGGPVPGVASVDCRADGMALVADESKSPVLVDAKGAITKPPMIITSQQLRFADDGSVLALGNDGVTRWRDDKVELAVPKHEHAISDALGNHGAYFEIVFEAPRGNGLWMTRDGVRIPLPQRPAELLEVSVAPDGAVAIADEMTAYGWTVANKRAGARQLLMDQSGYHIKAIAATTKRFVVIGADGDIWFAKRPAMKWDYIGSPCTDNEQPLAMAVTRDETRVAVACSDLGIRIFDFETKRRVDRPVPYGSAGSVVAWSPSGDRIATRSPLGIAIWYGTHRVATIGATDARSLWWASESKLGSAQRTLEWYTWTDGHSGGDLLRTKLAADLAVASPHGEIVVARRTKDKVAIVRGEVETPVALPDSKLTWIVGAAIDDTGTRALVWRGPYANQPAKEILEIDVAAATATLREVTVTAVAIAPKDYVYATPTGEVIYRDKPIGSKAEVTALAVMGELVIVGARDGSLTVLTLEGTLLGQLPSHSGGIRALAVSGHRLASTASDGTRLWDLAP